MSLTSYEAEGHKETYLLTVESGVVSCVSCPPRGVAPVGTSSTSPNAKLELGGYQPRFVLDDGTVFFDTLQSLVAQDANGARDVYEYQDGEVTLISGGRADAVSTFADASEDGSDVFFVTDDRLVKQDTDYELDMYDARVGGGIESQNKVEQEPCDAQRCVPPGMSPPAAPDPGSTQLRAVLVPRCAVRMCVKPGQRSWPMCCASAGEGIRVKQRPNVKRAPNDVTERSGRPGGESDARGHQRSGSHGGSTQGSEQSDQADVYDGSGRRGNDLGWRRVGTRRLWLFGNERKCEYSGIRVFPPGWAACRYPDPAQFQHRELGIPEYY